MAVSIRVAAAAAAPPMGSPPTSCSSPRVVPARGGAGRRRCAVRCAAVGSLTDRYRKLHILPGASEKEVKQAFRKLALQYHPDVCKGKDCGVEFHRINEAYDIVMSSLRARQEGYAGYAVAFASVGYTAGAADAGVDSGEEEEEEDDEEEEGYRGSSSESGERGWDVWEEWMGWEGASIRSRFNSYI